MNKLLIIANLFFILFSCVSFGRDTNGEYLSNADRLFHEGLEGIRANNEFNAKVFDYAVPHMIKEIEAKKESEEEWKDAPNMKKEDLLLLFRAKVIDIIDRKIVLIKKIKWKK